MIEPHGQYISGLYFIACGLRGSLGCTGEGSSCSAHGSHCTAHVADVETLGLRIRTTHVADVESWACSYCTAHVADVDAWDCSYVLHMGLTWKSVPPMGLTWNSVPHMGLTCDSVSHMKLTWSSVPHMWVTWSPGGAQGRAYAVPHVGARYYAEWRSCAGRGGACARFCQGGCLPNPFSTDCVHAIALSMSLPGFVSPSLLFTDCVHDIARSMILSGFVSASLFFDHARFCPAHDFARVGVSLTPLLLILSYHFLPTSSLGLGIGEDEQL